MCNIIIARLTYFYLRLYMKIGYVCVYVRVVSFVYDVRNARSFVIAICHLNLFAQAKLPTQIPDRKQEK